MRKLIKTLTLTALILLPAPAMLADTDTAPSKTLHNVVFQVTSDGTKKWLGALRNVENAKKSLGAQAGKFVLVAHGGALGMLVAENATTNPEMKQKLEELHADGVVFAACENTMRRDKVEKKDLIELATTVDSGVGEVIRKQGEGYSYVKIGG